MENSDIKTYIVDHYRKDKDVNGKQISNTRIIRETWLLREYKKCIDELDTVGKKKLANDIKLGITPDIGGPTVRIICGEFSSTHTTDMALRMGFAVDVVCGDHLFSGEIRDTVAKFKKNYGNKFRLYIYGAQSDGNDSRPPSHSANIGSNLFYEDEHKLDINDIENTSYGKAFIIENAPKEMLDDYLIKFNQIVNTSKEVTDHKVIETLPLLKEE